MSIGGHCNSIVLVHFLSSTWFPSPQHSCCFYRWGFRPAACSHPACHSGGETDAHQAAGSPWSHNPGAEHHPEGPVPAEGWRAGSGCLSCSGAVITFSASPGFPQVTGKWKLSPTYKLAGTSTGKSWEEAKGSERVRKHARRCAPRTSLFIRALGQRGVKIEPYFVSFV